jgi:potassium channel subfamily K protein 1
MVRGISSGCFAQAAERHSTALSFSLLSAGYVLYLLLGAGIFSAIELPYEERLRQDLKQVRQEFLDQNECVSDARLEELLARAIEASNYGVSVLGNQTEPNNWDFVSALFFTSTVLTTTGELGTIKGLYVAVVLDKGGKNETTKKPQKQI